jgi:hypothetical protein
MVLNLDVLKFLVIWAVLWLLVCAAAVVLLGFWDRFFLLFSPRPKLPLLLVFAVLWILAAKASYWWQFERYTFYGGR